MRNKNKKATDEDFVVSDSDEGEKRKKNKKKEEY